MTGDNLVPKSQIIFLGNVQVAEVLQLVVRGADTICANVHITRADGRILLDTRDLKFTGISVYFISMRNYNCTLMLSYIVRLFITERERESESLLILF